MTTARSCGCSAGEHLAADGGERGGIVALRLRARPAAPQRPRLRETPKRTQTADAARCTVFGVDFADIDDGREHLHAARLRLQRRAQREGQALHVRAGDALFVAVDAGAAIAATLGRKRWVTPASISSSAWPCATFTGKQNSAMVASVPRLMMRLLVGLERRTGSAERC